MNIIEKIQTKIEENCDTPFEIRYSLKNNLYDIDFISGGSAMPVCDVFFEYLNQNGVVEQIENLNFYSEDEGINGTNHWDLAKLADKPKNIFKNLKKLIFPLNTNNHNRMIITGNDDYEEKGVIGQVIRKMPVLEYLQIPSAPASNFFEAQTPIKHLSIQTGFAHQNFIENLARTNSLEHLETLEFWDYSEFYMESYQQYCTSVDAYIQLFGSTHLPKLRKITLYNTLLNQENQQKLQSLPLYLQLENFLVINQS
ncbi:MAG: hypothetical protein MUC49_10990 [Raineya sp.]|jgi:hypothetical protein|nr:hypothetical protein [Raineya sp.]